MREGFLKDIAFFTSKDDAFVAMIVPFLLPLSFQEKETVYKKGDHPNASKNILIKLSLLFNSWQSSLC